MQEESAENIKSDILPYDFVRENQVIASETKDGYILNGEKNWITNAPIADIFIIWALEENKDQLPTWRGHHEQNMALTGIAYARAKRRKQIFIATSSVGPGSTNMITAAAVAMSNRLPILFLPGDTYASRMPDPVLQQVEHFNNPGITQNDAFKPVTKYFDRLTRPAVSYTHLTLPTKA